MNCNLHNYKEWIDAYLNDALSRQDMLQAEAFLQTHPYILDTYLTELEEFSLAHNNETYQGKENLKIQIVPFGQITEQNFSEYFISDVENILTPAHKEELASFIRLNPKLQLELNTYSKTKLSPSSADQYPDKNGLLKKSRPVVPIFWRVSAAATILLLFGIWIFLISSQNRGMSFNLAHTIDLKIDSVKNNPIEIDIDNQWVAQDMVKEYPTNDVLAKEKIIAKKNLPIQIHPVKTVSVFEPSLSNSINNPEFAMKPIPQIEQNIPAFDNPVADLTPKKKGLFNKIFSGEKTYIEDYVNATFSAFKETQEEDKWVLKVDRDENGKSKKVKFTSPIFSVKSRN